MIEITHAVHLIVGGKPSDVEKLRQNPYGIFSAENHSALAHGNGPSFRDIESVNTRIFHDQHSMMNCLSASRSSRRDSNTLVPQPYSKQKGPGGEAEGDLPSSAGGIL